MCGRYFLGTLPAKHCLNATSWVLLPATSIPFWLQCSYLLMATSSRIMHRVAKLRKSQTACLNVTISLPHSNGFHSHHTSLLGCDKDSYHGCTADMHLQAVDQHNLMMPSSVRNVFSTLLTLYHKQSHPIKPYQGVLNKMSSDCVFLDIVIFSLSFALLIGWSLQPLYFTRLIIWVADIFLFF